MKRILFFILLFAGLQEGSAAHIMGGDITARNIGGLTYEVTLTLYYDPVPANPIDTTPSLYYYDTLTGFSQTSNATFLTLTIDVNGNKVYTFIDTVTFSQSVQYTIEHSSCCRNSTILNIPVSGFNNSFVLKSVIWADSTNSSPVFLNPPITLAQLYQPFFYNPLPYDADGDSLEWILDIPLTDDGLPVTGYTLPSSDTILPFILNSANGELSFKPNLQGYFQFAILVNEYRNGVQIGEIRRDMQINVVSSINSQASLNSSGSNTYPYSGSTYEVLPGSTFFLNLTIIDPNNQNMLLPAQGEAFLGVNPPSYAFLQSGNVATAIFSWVPNALQSRSNPYFSTIRIHDFYSSNVFMQDLTLSLRVGNFTGLLPAATGIQSLHVYPNPASEQVTIDFRSEANVNAELQVMTINGAQALPDYTIGLIQGANLIQVNTSSLADGVYLLQLVDADGKVLGRERLTVR